MTKTTGHVVSVLLLRPPFLSFSCAFMSCDFFLLTAITFLFALSSLRAISCNFVLRILLLRLWFSRGPRSGGERVSADFSVY